MARREERESLIASLLASYIPDDPDEIRYRTDMLRLAARGDITARDHFDPGHFTASAFVLHPSEPKVALVHHAKIRKWVQPGGHIDPGETPEGAARREVLEEIGLGDLASLGSGLFDIDIHAFPGGVGSDPGHLHFDLRMAYRSLQDEMTPNSEVLEAVWVPLAEAGGIPLDRSVARPMAKLRTLLEAG